MMKKNNNLFQNVINIFLNVLVVFFSFVLLISIYCGIQTKIMGHSYSNFFGYSLFEVQTGSMKPTINAGDWIVVKLTKDISLKDIVTYESNGEFITHRVVELYQNSYVAMGDANTGKDGVINKEQTVGKVVKILGHIGIIKSIFLNPTVLIALIVTIVLCSFAFKKGDNNLKNMKIYKNIVAFIKEKSGKSVKKVASKHKKMDIDEIFDDYDKNNDPSKFDSEVEKEKKVNDEKIDNHQDVVENGEIEEFEEEKMEEDAKPDNNIATKITTSSDSKEYTLDDLNNLSDDELEQELDKTVLFREVLVDSKEISNTLLEIANNQIDNDEKNVEKRPKEDVSDSEEDSEVVDNVGLEILNSRRGKGKSKNILDKVMSVKYEEISEMLNELTADEIKEVNEATIKNNFIESYINAKYYDDYTGVSKEYASNRRKIKIEKYLKDIGEKFNNDYKGNDRLFNSKIKKYCRLMALVAVFEDGERSIDDSKTRIELYKDEITNCFDNVPDKKFDASEISRKIAKIQRSYRSVFAYLLRKLDTNMFELIMNKVSCKGNELYALSLKHNLSFNKIYSDYIVDKTYNEGVIAEDKLNVSINLLSVQLINDMFNRDFDTKYILYITKSLYGKKRKLESLLKLIEDDYAKDHIVLLVSYDDYITNLEYIKKLYKGGYKFAIALTGDTKKSIFYGNLYIAEYVFVNKDDDDMVKIVSSMPNDAKEHIIYDDIVSKVGGFEVDKE